MAQITIKTIGGEMLDAITHKHYHGRPGITEKVLNANPGLAKLGPVLPAGIKIILPVLPDTKAGVLQLWD